MTVKANKVVSVLLVLSLKDFIIADGSSNLSPIGQVQYCPGEPLVFTCIMARVSSIETLRWRIHFPGSLSMSDLTPSYLTTDEEGHTHMLHSGGHYFLFNLTVNNQSELVSTLTVTESNKNASTIDNATVFCPQDSHHNALILAQGIPASPIIVNKSFSHNEEMNDSFIFELMWIPSGINIVDGYNIVVSSSGPIMSTTATFTTNDTAVQISVFYNEEYNISVMANNCAGNSTPAEMNVRIGFCDPPNVGSNVTVTISGKSSGVEGTKIICYCQQSGVGTATTKEMISTCMSDGSWSPDPRDLECLPNNNTIDTISTLSGLSLTPPFGTATKHKLLVISITTALLVVVTLTSIAIIVLISFVFHRKVQKRSNNNMVEDGIPSLHSDNNQTTRSADNEGNYTQEIGIYSLLQSEEPAYSSTNLGDPEKKQAGELVYADIGHSIHLTSSVSTTHPNLSLQLDDDHVQYAGIDHQLTASKLDTTLENTDTGPSSNALSDDALDLDTVLIQIRSHVTSKWQQFGVAVGLSKDQLEKYAGYPEEECIVEVVDYWLRNHPLTITKPTWMDMAKALREIELHHLADIILSKYKEGQVNNIVISESDDVPPPVPSKMFDLDEDMTQLPLSTPALTQSGCEIAVRVSYKGSSPPPLPPPYTETRLSTIAPPVPPKNNLQN